MFGIRTQQIQAYMTALRSVQISDAMQDYMEVYVPYCTSDAYSGRKVASSETGGVAFNCNDVAVAVKAKCYQLSL